MSVAAGESGIRVGVVGCGRMGCSIAAYLAIRECSVVAFDETEFTRTRALQSINGQLAELVQQNMLLQSDAEEAQRRIRVADTLEAVADVELLVEAVPDDLELKRTLLRRLDEIASPTCILSTNSINFLISDVMPEGAKHACCGVRFLFPVYFIKKVEVSGGRNHIWGARHTEDGSRAAPVARVKAMLTHMGFEPFEYTGGSRTLLSAVEVERIQYQQRQRVLSQQERDVIPSDSAATLYHTDGGVSLDSQVIESGPLMSETGECNICCETRWFGMLLPCGHTGVCIECARGLVRRDCPICRQTVERFVPKTQ